MKATQPSPVMNRGFVSPAPSHPLNNLGEADPITGQMRCSLCNASTEPSKVPGYRECRACQLLQVEQVPSTTELAHYYSEDFEVDRNNYLRSIARRGHREMEWLESLTPRGQLLEVGCSWGKFLDIARSRGWQTAGVELSQPSSEFARSEFNLNVFTGRLEDSPFVGSKAFDLVAAWHVIEHVPDPLEFLRACRSCLRPGGYIVLKTPNVASFSARANGRAWSWIDPASRHLVLFSPAGLTSALAKSGFEVKHVFTRRGDGNNLWLELTRGTVIRSGLHGQVKRSLRVDSAAGKRQVSQRRVDLLSRLNRAFDVGLFFLWPVEEILNRVNLGCELRTVAIAR